MVSRKSEKNQGGKKAPATSKWWNQSIRIYESQLLSYVTTKNK